MTALEARLVAETTQTVEVELKPSLKRKLLNELTVYAQLRTQLKALEAQIEGHKEIIEECVIESGEQALTIDGYKTTMVFPQRSTFDKKLFVQQGGTLAQIANATITKPGKHYLKVTCPGDKEWTPDE